MVNLFTSLIVAFWVSAIALVSVQNARPVSLRFLTFQSIQLPVGLVLAFSAAGGMVGATAVLPLLKGNLLPPQRHERPDQDHDFEEL
jgi:uncharacterized integral membrane protein